MSHSRIGEARRLQVVDHDTARYSCSRRGFGGGTGHFGSGEAFAVRLVPELTAIQIGIFRFGRATIVHTQDARQLEGMTPDLVGSLGHHAWAGDAMKPDYRASGITFY